MLYCFHVLVSLFLDFCCLTTAFLLFDNCLNNEMDVMEALMEKRSKKCSDEQFIQNIIDLTSIWRRYQIRKGSERNKLEQSTRRRVCIPQLFVSLCV